ncbi:MAG: hypothetical protein ACFB50_01860 [Rubrobacteraceae bacterium]
MSATTHFSFVLVYGLALWLGLYLIGRDPRSPRLLLTGLGLVSYALAVAGKLLVSVSSAASFLVWVQWPLLLLPALLWTGALLHLLPEESKLRRPFIRVWMFAVLPATLVLAGLVGSGTELVFGSTGVLQVLIGAAVLLPMLASGCFVWWTWRGRRGRKAAAVLVLFTLFLALSTVLILAPFTTFTQPWVLLTVGFDVVGLGLALAYFDAFDLGEALLSDMVRSFDAALLAALVFGGQVAVVIWLSTGLSPPMMALVLAVVGTAIATTTFGDRLAAALDSVSLGRLSRERRARSELRATAGALPRRDPALDPATLDEEEFARLTRRALGNFGDLPRLSASPLINLHLIDHRLSSPAASENPLERAAELKTVLAESVSRLKPRTQEDFGTSDEWRYYNALYFPYMAGIKPYRSRNPGYPKDPAAREALAWFRDTVPERTFYNWQNAAARLVARDLLSRNASPSE